MADCVSQVTLIFPAYPNNSYSFQFNGPTPLGGGLFRWCYTVNVELEPGSGRGLSHFILEFCEDITLDNISNVTKDGNLLTYGEDYEFGDIKIFPPDDDPSIYGIKFNEVGLDDGESATFCFDLNVNVLPAPGDLSIKTGGGPASESTVLTEEDAICTPGCETPPPPPGRGIYCSL